MAIGVPRHRVLPLYIENQVLARRHLWVLNKEVLQQNESVFGLAPLAHSQRMAKSKGGSVGWLAATPSKAAAEAFFLRYSIYWIGVFGVVVATRVYHVFLRSVLLLDYRF